MAGNSELRELGSSNSCYNFQRVISVTELSKSLFSQGLAYRFHGTRLPNKYRESRLRPDSKIRSRESNPKLESTLSPNSLLNPNSSLRTPLTLPSEAWLKG
ncbi:hypothetical protein AVEN_123503-1 [Araneus ventricosus]|uniref:Uncharacterized protein n=1 Tax=Araneus ventricosus TaxID=182803 RepID=A0A4Y2IKB4_ARAVE|nr:hypothetical protein AVEN_123503-1 [Araneus ventricosus]